MFKDEFKKLRIDGKYTQEDLAKFLEVSKSTISMYESGSRIPGLEMLEAIADFFNIDMNRLTSSEISTTNASYARNETERKILLLARHLDKIPAEKRERIVKNFEDTIDTYLDAMGIDKGENDGT